VRDHGVGHKAKSWESSGNETTFTMTVKVDGMGEGHDNGLRHHYNLNLWEAWMGVRLKNQLTRQTSAGTITVNQRTAGLVLC
jgi:hypothetical protein